MIRETYFNLKRSLLTAFVVGVILFFSYSTSAEEKNRDCLQYEPDITSITGTLEKKVFKSNENSELESKGDMPQKYFVLKLDTPICIKASTTDEAYIGKSDIQTIRISSFDKSDTPEKYENYLNRHVAIIGELFHGTDGYHNTPVKIRLIRIRPVNMNNDCLEYWPDVVTLEGVFENKMYPAPEDESAIVEGERPYAYGVIKLDNPICVNASPIDPFEDGEKNVSIVAVNSRRIHDYYENVKSYLSKKVAITGELSHATTGHHRTAVMIDASKVKVIRNSSSAQRNREIPKYKKKTDEKKIDLFPLPLAGVKKDKECYEYFGDSVNLTGVIHEKIFPGPPRWKSVDKGDFAYRYWILQLDDSICMNASPPFSERQKNQKDVQLAMDGYSYNRYRSLLEKKVVVSGHLRAASTAHHRTPVQVITKKIMSFEEVPASFKKATPKIDVGKPEQEIEECVEYWPEVVSIYGTFQKRMPPDTEDAIALLEEEKPYYYVLELENPICVNAAHINEINTQEQNIRTIQIDSSHISGFHEKAENHISQKAVVSGHLHRATKARHHTSVIIDARKILMISKNR